MEYVIVFITTVIVRIIRMINIILHVDFLRVLGMEVDINIVF